MHQAWNHCKPHLHILKMLKFMFAIVAVLLLQRINVKTPLFLTMHHHSKIFSCYMGNRVTMNNIYETLHYFLFIHYCSFIATCFGFIKPSSDNNIQFQFQFHKNCYTHSRPKIFGSINFLHYALLILVVIVLTLYFGLLCVVKSWNCVGVMCKLNY
jgi:hypothetical protein